MSPYLLNAPTIVNLKQTISTLLQNFGIERINDKTFVEPFCIFLRILQEEQSVQYKKFIIHFQSDLDELINVETYTKQEMGKHLTQIIIGLPNTYTIRRTDDEKLCENAVYNKQMSKQEIQKNVNTLLQKHRHKSILQVIVYTEEHNLRLHYTHTDNNTEDYIFQVFDNSKITNIQVYQIPENWNTTPPDSRKSSDVGEEPETTDQLEYLGEVATQLSDFKKKQQSASTINKKKPYYPN